MDVNSRHAPAAYPLSRWEGPPRGIGPVLRAFGEAMLIGLLVAAMDLCDSGASGLEWIFPAYLVAGLVLGFRRGADSWACWPLLGASLFVAHVAAIRCGLGSPYVEADLSKAQVTLLVIAPAGLGLAAGALARGVVAIDRQWRAQRGRGLPFVPRTLRGWTLAVAGIGLALGLVRLATLHPQRDHAAGSNEGRFPEVRPSMTAGRPQGDAAADSWEGRFQEVRPGMTASQVEAKLGPPTFKEGSPEGGEEVWKYESGPGDASRDFKRWVFLNRGKVKSTQGDFDREH